MGSSGRVYLVGAGPGDPELLTLKAARLLGEADAILYDNLVQPSFLELASPQCELVYVGKKCGRNEHTQEEINALIVKYAQTYRAVVRLKGGDPFVFGRGGEEAQALKDHGIAFEIVPGVSSAIAGPAYAGIPVTDRRCASSVTFITGHPAPGRDLGGLDWTSFARLDTLVFLMAVAGRQEVARRLIAAGRDASDPVAFIENATLPSQRLLRTSLGVVAEAPPNVASPALMVVGEVAASQLEWFIPAAARERGALTHEAHSPEAQTAPAG